jgi:GMC oxidoreductase/GTP cyclohydrolase I
MILPQLEQALRPSSISACSTQRRSDSGATPSSSATARNGATRPAAERAAADLLAALGVELDAEHLREMPRRVAQAYAELLTPRPFNPTTFPNDERYDELVVVDDIRFQSRSAPSAPLVLLLEAGPRDRSKEIRIPAAFSKLFKSKFDWGYETTPQRGRLYFPRGKTLGGSSAMNAQMHIPGHPADKPTSDSSACNGPFPLWAGRRMGGGAGLFSQPQKGAGSYSRSTRRWSLQSETPIACPHWSSRSSIRLGRLATLPEWSVTQTWWPSGSAISTLSSLTFSRRQERSSAAGSSSAMMVMLPACGGIPAAYVKSAGALAAPTGL